MAATIQLSRSSNLPFCVFVRVIPLSVVSYSGGFIISGKLGAGGPHLTVVSKPGMGVPAVTIVTKPSGQQTMTAKPAIRISTGWCFDILILKINHFRYIIFQEANIFFGVC